MPLSHPGEKNPSAKLTGEQVRELRAMYQTGKFNQRELANMFGIHFTTVNGIVKGRSWKEVVPDAELVGTN